MPNVDKIPAPPARPTAAAPKHSSASPEIHPLIVTLTTSLAITDTEQALFNTLFAPLIAQLLADPKS